MDCLDVFLTLKVGAYQLKYPILLLDLPDGAILRAGIHQREGSTRAAAVCSGAGGQYAEEYIRAGEHDEGPAQPG